MRSGFERVAGSGFANGRQSQRRNALIESLFAICKHPVNVAIARFLVRLGLGGLVGSRSTLLVNDVTKTRTGK